MAGISVVAEERSVIFAAARIHKRMQQMKRETQNFIKIIRPKYLTTLNQRHPGKMVSPSFAWETNHLSGISLIKLWIPDTKTHFQGKALNSSKFRDDVHCEGLAC